MTVSFHWSDTKTVFELRLLSSDGTEVRTIRRPDRHKLYPNLLDAGTTSDGTGNDGVYAALVEDGLPGSYHVDAAARGASTTGEAFERYMSGTIIIPGREPPPAGSTG